MSEIHVVAASRHEIPEREPIRIEPGDRVDVGERDTTWPSFVFVTTASGSGWVPERHLDEDRPVATVLASYDTKELPVTAGDHLTIVDDDPTSGWCWCRNTAGRTGWGAARRSPLIRATARASRPTWRPATAPPACPPGQLGSVQDERSKQQGRRLPERSLEMMLASTRRSRV